MTRFTQTALLLLGVLLLAVYPVWGQTATEEPNHPDQLFGRVLRETYLATNPNGVVYSSVKPGWEFELLEEHLTDQGELWWEVSLIANGEIAWMRAADGELALPESTQYRRRYADGWCVATPIEVSRLPDVGWFSRYQHAMYFDDAVVLAELEEPIVVFNARPREIALRLDVEQNAYLLPATWVALHSGPLPPFYDEEGFWQLVYECPVEVG